MNTDAVVFVEEEAIGVGLIIRDWRGRVVVAAAKRVRGSMEAHIVEARAAKEGVFWAWEMGLRSIILEGDAKIYLRLLTSMMRIILLC